MPNPTITTIVATVRQTGSADITADAVAGATDVTCEAASKTQALPLLPEAGA